MNFKQLNKEVSKEFGITQKEAENILIFIQKLMLKKLKFGTNITLREIGTIQVRVRKPKKYLNFQKNEMMTTAKKYYLFLHVPLKLKEFLSNKTCH